jgi:hypothetical protein
VFHRFWKTVTGCALAGTLATLAMAQAPKAPAYKDQGESDIVAALQKETDLVKKVDLVKQWEQKYPDSDFKGMRAIVMVQTESPIAAKGLQPSASAADLANASKAAQDLADNADKYFSDENKQPNVTPQQWATAKTGVALTAHTVLATIAMGKKNAEGDAAAEAEFKKVLGLAPDSAATAYQLGTLILREKKIERIPEALYYIAHSVAVSGPMALNAAGKKAAEDYLSKAYEGYHGDKDGLDDLKKTASASPMPPAGFTIKSVTQIGQEKDADAAKFAAEHPDIALWRTIRTALTAADGDSYFASSVKDAGLPPADGSFKMFTGKVVEQKSPSELILNVDGPAGDVSIQFTDPLKGTIDVGSEVKFKGTVDSFNKDPYMLTFKDLDKEDVEGIPDTAFAAVASPKKKTPKAAPKKK